MGDWRRHFRAPLGGWAHPDSPAGGIGPGFSRAPGHPHHWDSSNVPHPDSPAGRTFDWSALARIDIDDRVRAVVDAIKVAQRHAPAMIADATGVEFGAILDGLLPGLLMCLCVVVATTALGTVAGAAIGTLALGIGAGPGAGFGDAVGFESGVALLEGLGCAFLVAVIGKSVAEAGQLAKRAVREAWHSVDEPRSRGFHVDRAGRTLAAAAAALMRGVLQGIVAFLVAKGANAAASRVPELVTKLRGSKLGEGFAAWVERNWASLIKNERLQQKQATAQVGAGKAGGGGTPSNAESGSSKAATRTPPASRSSGVRDVDAPTPEKAARPSFEEQYAKAPAAKEELDGVADDVARGAEGKVAKAPIKSRARALEKINGDYGGDPTKIKDLARNTIVVRADKIDWVADELAARRATDKRIDTASDPMGYSGVNATMPTKSGLTGEIQVNSPEMIYAKEPEPVARSILGDAEYDAIAAKTGVPGGQGHALYEDYRQLPRDSAEASQLAEESRAYYDSVRTPADGN